MSEKAIAEIYFTYGKGDGEELYSRIVIDDTPEGRNEIFEYFGYDDLYDSKDDFINGKISGITFGRHGGDWDEPTGGHVVINTKQGLIDAIKEEAEQEIEEIEKLFK